MNDKNVKFECSNRPHSESAIEEEGPFEAEALETDLRRSSRVKHLTPKMQELKEQEYAQNEKKFRSAHEKWRTLVREVRTNLKQECPQSELYNIMDDVEKHESELTGLYDSMRLQMLPSQEIRRKIDA